MYQALYRKWRPRIFDDVVGQAHITDTLKRQVETGRLSHAYLFTGTRGTGKTTCAKILSRAVNCEAPVDGNPCNCCSSCVGIESGSILDVLELDAASNNGVDQVRALRDEAVYTPAAVKKRVYIVDEVHMLTTQAFNALLKILEEPPAHLLFILATTELHKVPATIKSRCQQFSFKRIRPTDIAGQLHRIAGEEGIKLSDEGAILLSRLADGGLRDALSLLDQCIGNRRELGEADILDSLGLAGNLEIARLMEHIIAQDAASALSQLDVLYRGGKEIGALFGELSSLLRDLLVKKTASQSGDALLTGGYEDKVLAALSQTLSPAEILQMLTLLQKAAGDLYRSSNRRTDGELCLVRLCARAFTADVEGLTARIDRLEARLSQGVPLVNQPQTQTAPMPQAVPQGHAPAVSAPKPLPEDAPPWDEPSPPASAAAAEKKAPPEPTKAPPPQKVEAVAESPAPKAETVLPTTSVPPASLPQEGGENWRSFAPTLRGKVSPVANSFLTKGDFATGIFEEKTLTVYVDSEMTKAVLNKAEDSAALEREAQAFTGRALRLVLEVGKPPAAAPKAAAPQPAAEMKEDKLDQLLKLGQQHTIVQIIKE